MYIVITKNIVKEDGIKDYIEVSKKFVEDTAKQEGCIEAMVGRDKSINNCVVNFEKWKSKEAFEAYDGSAFLKYKAELKKNFISNTSLMFEAL